MPPASRGQLLKDLARLILQDRERLAQIVIAEQGKPLQEARGEIESAALYLTYAAEEARRITGDIIPSDLPDEQIWIQRVAHGVVIGLTAWNYPAGLMCRKIGPALVAGNTIVIKSHEGTPTTALEIAQLSRQARFSARRDQCRQRHGRRDRAGARAASHPAAHHAHRQRPRRQGHLPQRRRGPQGAAARAWRQGALHRRRGRRYRRRGARRRAVALRELRADLHLQRAHVRAREDGRRVPRASSSVRSKC